MADPQTPQPDPAQASAPGFDLASVYSKLKDQFEQEMGQAQQARSALRATADQRARRAQIFGSSEEGNQLRDRLMKESDLPVSEVLERHSARENAVKEAVQQGQVAAQGWQNQQLLRRMDATSEESRAAQAFATKHGLISPDLAPKMSAFALEQALPGLKGLAETFTTTATGKGAEATAEATRSATKLKEEAAPGERAKTAAETTSALAGAGKTAAEARKIELQTGGSPYPGWLPSGESMTSDEDWKSFHDSAAANQIVHENTERLKELLGGGDFIANPTKRAEAKQRAGVLLGAAKEMVPGIQRIAGPEMSFLETMSVDPTKVNLGNLLGTSKNRVKLETLSDLSDKALEQKAAGRFKRAPTASAPEAGKAAPAQPNTVQMKFPDGKVRPVHESRIRDAIKAGAVQVKGNG